MKKFRKRKKIPWIRNLSATGQNFLSVLFILAVVNKESVADNEPFDYIIEFLNWPLLKLIGIKLLDFNLFLVIPFLLEMKLYM